MNSAFANLFLALQARIAAIVLDPLATPTVPAIKHIDQDFGQMEDHNGNNRPPVTFPCILIDINSATFTDYSQNAQSGNCKVVLRLGFTPYSSSAMATPTDYKEKAIAYYDIEYLLHQALQPWSPDGDTGNTFGAMNRISAVSENREDFLRVRAIIYDIAFEDFSTKTQITLSPASIHLTDQFDFNI